MHAEYLESASVRLRVHCIGGCFPFLSSPITFSKVMATAFKKWDGECMLGTFCVSFKIGLLGLDNMGSALQIERHPALDITYYANLMCFLPILVKRWVLPTQKLALLLAWEKRVSWVEYVMELKEF